MPTRSVFCPDPDLIVGRRLVSQGMSFKCHRIPGPSLQLRCTMQAAGLRMAALTTLSRLLEAKVVELEGDDGTGPLETDIALLQARCAR